MFALSCFLLLFNMGSSVVLLFGNSFHEETKRLTWIGRAAASFILISAIGGMVTSYIVDRQATEQADKSERQMMNLTEKAEQAEKLLVASQADVQSLRTEVAQRDSRDQEKQRLKEAAEIRQRQDAVRQRGMMVRQAIRDFARASAPRLQAEYLTDTGMLNAINRVDIDQLQPFADDFSISNDERKTCRYLIRNGAFFNKGMADRRKALMSGSTLTDLMTIEATHQYTRRAEAFIAELDKYNQTTPIPTE